MALARTGLAWWGSCRTSRGTWWPLLVLVSTPLAAAGSASMGWMREVVEDRNDRCEANVIREPPRLLGGERNRRARRLPVPVEVTASDDDRV